MDKLLGFLNLSILKSERTKNDDDAIDRLNHRYTPFIFTIFAVVVTSRQYVWDPISCWTPAHFTSSYIQYTNMVCWVSNTYYLPFGVQEIPDVLKEDNDRRQMINYYQWVPLILLFQALLFHAPFAIWKALNSKSGIDVTAVVDAGCLLQCFNQKEKRNEVIEHLSNQFDDYLISTREYRSESWFTNFRHSVSRKLVILCGLRYGNYVLGLYLGCKILYVINAICQIFVINIFLANEFPIYGLEILSKWYAGVEHWSGSWRFPRVTLCDFKVRALARVQTHTVQVRPF